MLDLAILKLGKDQPVIILVWIVMHELMHAAGFWHEQSRADRDDYISINWKNILPGMEYNFIKYDLRKIDHLGADYDTCSVMHYGAYAFSRRYGQPTIIAKRKSNCKMGQRKGFSDTDIRKLNTLYQCRGLPQTSNSLISSKPSKPNKKPWVKPSCQDQNKYCATWAASNECKTNPSWMLVSCPVACDQCKIQCDNFNVYCQDWADMGQCSTNKAYMDIYCPKACKKCKSKLSSCRDESKTCSKWASRGYCRWNKYKDYMKLRCKKSCKLC